MIFGKDSMENALWGASRIHGELLKLGYDALDENQNQPDL
jgi:hypothetical protein